MREPEVVDTAAAAERLREKSVIIEPGAPFFAPQHRKQNYYRLGYSSIPASRIEPGLALLSEALKPS